MEEDDLDFEDPKFLLQLQEQEQQQELTYAQKRKRDIIRGQERGQKKSRREQEHEAREQGLSRNLLDETRAGEGEGESKALRMMKGMGFKLGQGLGRKRSPSPPSTPNEPVVPEASTSTTTNDELPPSLPRSGIGSKTRRTSPKPLTEPIQFSMRTGRAGLGVPSNPSTTYTSTSSSSSSHQPPKSSSLDPLLSTYLTQSKESHLTSPSRIFGLLQKVLRTMIDLDERFGIREGENWRWGQPGDGERVENEGRRRRRWEGGVGREGERDGIGVGDGGEEGLDGERKEEGKGGGELGYEKELSETVVELDEEEEGGGGVYREGKGTKNENEASLWLTYDDATRLSLSLLYLREKYHYCFWCGTKYDDKDDLEENCPGEEEGDH